MTTRTTCSTTFKLFGRPLTVVADAGADDSISAAIRRRDRSIFIEFADVAPIVAPDSLVIDVGAHVGVASLFFLQRGHRVVSFEASPANARLLREARERNGFDDRWTIVEAAVAGAPGTLRFRSDGPAGHLTDGDDATDTVEATTLDAWLASAPARPIGLVKMDIEGAEVAAIAGARTLLAAPNAPPLFIESNGHCLHRFGETPESLRASLVALGYRIFGIHSRRVLRPTRFYPVAADELQARGCVNYLCVKDAAALRAHAPVAAGPRSQAELVRDIAKTFGGDNDDDRRYLRRALHGYPALAALPAVRDALEER